MDIIRTASEEHEECMTRLDDVRAQRQTKHIGVGKMSKPKGQKEISLTTSAFRKVTPTTNEDCEASPILKEKGCKEAIEMAAKFHNPPSDPQRAKVVVIQQNSQDSTSAIMSIPSRSQTGDSYIEDRQNRRNQVLEQFIREAKRKCQITAVHKNKIRENFRIRQEAGEQRHREEERQKQIELDKMLAMKLQQDEENHRR